MDHAELRRAVARDPEYRFVLASEDGRLESTFALKGADRAQRFAEKMIARGGTARFMTPAEWLAAGC